MLLRHEAGARFVGQYDFNNAYQYIINREEVQLSWLGAAIAELGGHVVDSIDAPTIAANHADVRPILEGDALYDLNIPLMYEEGDVEEFIPSGSTFVAHA